MLHVQHQLAPYRTLTEYRRTLNEHHKSQCVYVRELVLLVPINTRTVRVLPMYKYSFHAQCTCDCACVLATGTAETR